MSYTIQDLSILRNNIPPTNFGVTSLSLANTDMGIIIEDAISFDENGNIVFKDAKTKTTLEDILSFKKYIFEKYSSNLGKTLYFTDKNNITISLGQLYKKIFMSKVKAPIAWWGNGIRKQLDTPLEMVILSNFYNKNTETISNDDGTTSLEINYTPKLGKDGLPLNWKGFWFDIPGIQLVTPDFIDNKIIQAFANISFSVRVPYPTPIEIIFRIYDATTDKELARNVYRTTGNLLAENITIPISYHGPMPDSPIVDPNDTCKCITMQDYDNLALDNGKDSGSKILQNPEGYFMIPQSRHVIKVQWQTCSIVEEYLSNFSMGRRYGVMGETTLDALIFDSYPTIGEAMLYNGSFNTNSVVRGVQEKTITFDNTSFNFGEDYVVSLTTNRNIGVSVIKQLPGEFTIKWNRAHNDCIIDWYISQTIKENEKENLERLTDATRELNYYYFIDSIENRITRNACSEITKCIEEFASYKFYYILPPGGQLVPYNDNLLVGGYSEYSLQGYEDISGGSIVTKYYRSVTIPEYIPYFEASDNPLVGVWRYQGSMAPGSKITFYYTAMDGYCTLDKEELTLPIANGPRTTCEKCSCIGGTIVRFKIIDYEWDIPPVGTTEYYYYEDEYGTKAYASTADKIIFDTIIESVDYSTLPSFIAVSGSLTGAGGESVAIWQVLEYDNDVYDTTNLITSVPYPDIKVNDLLEINENLTIDTINEEIYKEIIHDTMDEYITWKNNNVFIGLGIDNEELAQVESSSNILLSVAAYSGSYARYLAPFDGENSRPYFLKTSAEKEGQILFCIPKSGFLGVRVFGYNIVVFDPALISYNLDIEPIFPGYLPIGNLQSYSDVISYIRSAKKFSFRLPIFPNFKVNTIDDGVVVVNGAYYNPLYDVRNYRMLGSYLDVSSIRRFIPNNIEQYSPAMTVDSLFRYDSIDTNTYKIATSLDISSPIITGIYNDLPQRCIPSNKKFILSIDSLWDASTSISTPIEF